MCVKTTINATKEKKAWQLDSWIVSLELCDQVFWLIPPTDENLSLYVSWTLSSRQNDVFFGDIVKTCYRITLEAGWTFFIPTGTTLVHI